MNTLQVDLGKRSYPIHIGQDLIGSPELVLPHVRGKQVLIVTNTTVAPLYLEKARAAFPDRQVATLVLPDGEKYKTLETLNLIYDCLLEHRFHRQATLVALGGGVIGDITGFAAASYQRGVDFIQIPTTLLAQVDSSVGGKTGVNHPLGKNMIGAFHQPVCVVADTGSLNTLEDRQLSAGIAEIIKYGLIRDPAFFTWLEQNMEALLNRNPETLAYAIERSCRNKAEVVARDETEQGERALLNLGHTFGHAIETGMGYGTWLHGEAVATGMIMAADMSKSLGWLDQKALQQVANLIDRAQLPTRAPSELSTDRFIELMGVDKKVQDGHINLVLLKTIGQAVVTGEFAMTLLRHTIDEHHALTLTRGPGLS